MISVVIVDDQALIRAGFSLLVESTPDMTVAGEAATGEQALALVHQTRPDVVLMDIQMPGAGGLAATRAIVTDEQLAGTRILILTTFEIDDYIFEALRGGASGFLLKDTAPLELLAAIRTVAAGEALLSPSVTRRLITEFVARPERRLTAPAALDVLTDREREVLALVAAGLNNDEIAQELCLSPATARTHVSRTMTKLAARDRAQLVVIAYETGLVQPPP